jgi:hypothetical protein
VVDVVSDEEETRRGCVNVAKSSLCAQEGGDGGEEGVRRREKKEKKEKYARTRDKELEAAITSRARPTPCASFPGR